MLISFGGRSGTGETTIAREVARERSAVHLRIDSIEHVMREAGWQIEGEGYRVAQAVAEDNLRLGRIVIADCVNPWPLTRADWRDRGRSRGRADARGRDRVFRRARTPAARRNASSGYHRSPVANVAGSDRARLPSVGYPTEGGRHPPDSPWTKPFKRS
jgi:hypothetical protein